MVFLALIIQAIFLASLVSCYTNSITTETTSRFARGRTPWFVHNNEGKTWKEELRVHINDERRNKANPAFARRRDDYDGNEDDEYIDDFDDDDVDNFNSSNEQRRRRWDRRVVDDLGNFRDRTGLDVPSSYGRRDGWRLPTSVSKSLLAGVFVLGIGLGVTVDSQVNTNPKDLASRDAIDNAAPNPNLCATLGASAMAFDQRVFVSFNPFNVYVSQADVKPACVLREANVVPVLKARGLINDDEVRSCKQNMNTWAFVGSLDDTPQLSCVYKSRDAQNEFLSNPKVGIGEDYLDDDRMMKTGKIVKGTLTEGQKDMVRDQLAR
jgi:F0F1-type ATP synthase assembly protein I